MKTPKHIIGSRHATSNLNKWGLSFEHLEKIGTFAVTWGLFESHLERAIWVIKEEDVAGKRPSTDSMKPSDMIKILRTGRPDFTDTTNQTLMEASVAAEDLMNYRHSLMHGMLVPLGGTPFFMRNTLWHEVKRKRSFGDAQVDLDLLDLAIDAAWVLFRVVFTLGKFMKEPYNSELIDTFSSESRRIKSNASELRHISRLATHEKY